MSTAEMLTRTTFSTNRMLEFFTESELRTQIGYGREMWPAVLAKELIDNALDACESENIAPQVEVILEPDTLTVSDNGPGLPAETITRSLDYSVRISDKKHYVSPTRGQLGNALKCVWAAPFVVSGNSHGQVEVTSCGERRIIDVRLNKIAQTPEITTDSESFVQNGTSIRVRWPELSSSLADIKLLNLYNSPLAETLDFLLATFAAINPHTSFTLKTPVGTTDHSASASKWVKWQSNQPTSAHWYTPEQLRDLVAAYVHDENNGGRARTIRDFVSEFDGLRRPQYQKRVLEISGRSGHLHDLVHNNDIPLAFVNPLLDAMKTVVLPSNLDSQGLVF